MSRKLLKIATALLALVPILTGLVGLLGVEDPLYRAAQVPPIAVLDSNLRFFSGVWLGLGLALMWAVPRIETQTVLFRTAWIAIFFGGIGRLLSLFLMGSPPVPFIGFTTLEIVGAPLFVYWQHQVASVPRTGET